MKTATATKQATLAQIFAQMEGVYLGGEQNPDGSYSGFTKKGDISIGIQGYNEESRRASAFIPFSTLQENVEILTANGFPVEDILIRGGIYVSLRKAEPQTPPANAAEVLRGKAGKGKAGKAGKVAVKKGPALVSMTADQHAQFLAFQAFQKAQAEGE